MAPSEGPVVLVSGATSGVGRVTALELARRGFRVVMANRSAQKAEPVLKELKAASPSGFGESLPLDLGDLASVRACAARFLALGLPLDVLLNNAGVAGQRGLTQSGFELHFGTNHLGHFLLTQLLLSKLLEGARPRVVNVSSESHYAAKALDFSILQRSTPTFTGLKEYEVSKLCNVLHARELSKRYGPKLVAVSLHPGMVDTEAWRRMPWPVRALLRLKMLTDVEGSKASLHCCTAETLEPGAFFWSDAVARKPNRLALDDALAEELWRKSEAWTTA